MGLIMEILLIIPALLATAISRLTRPAPGSFDCAGDAYDYR